MKEFFRPNKFIIIVTLVGILIPWVFGALKFLFPALGSILDNLFWIYAIPFFPVAVTIIFLGFSRMVWDVNATVILLIVSVCYSYLLACVVNYFKKKSI